MVEAAFIKPFIKNIALFITTYACYYTLASVNFFFLKNYSLSKNDQFHSSLY